MIDCGHPGVPPNAVLSGEKYTFGSTVHYACAGKRSLVGLSSRTCQLSGHWSGSQPHCSGTTWRNGQCMSEITLLRIYEQNLKIKYISLVKILWEKLKHHLYIIWTISKRCKFRGKLTLIFHLIYYRWIFWTV